MNQSNVNLTIWEEVMMNQSIDNIWEEVLMNQSNDNIWEDVMMNQTNDNNWKEVMMNQKFYENSTMWEADIRYEMINDVYDNIPTKVITILICIFVLTIGNALWFGIIHFELYGGDPKKRSITNKAR